MKDTSDLMGFAVIKNVDSNYHKCVLSINSKHIRLSYEAISVIQSEYINIFTDERHGRIMVKAAEKETPNSYHMIRTGGHETVRDGVIGKNMLATCTSVLGRGRHFGYIPEGHERTIIFER